MPHFITIGYGDTDGYERTDPAVRDAAHAHDARLRDDGAVIGVAGTPIQVRNHAGRGLQTQSGAFLNAALPVAGFPLIEASNVEEAVELVSQTPCAIAHGGVEVWPLEDA